MPAPARRVAVVTDSASCVPAADRERFGIGVVPYRLSWGRESYRDLLDIGPEEFYERFLAGSPFPTTSTPTPSDFAEAFGKAARDSEGIVHVHVTARLRSSGRASGAP